MVDLFAGAGGWCEGAAMAGVVGTVGLEREWWPCATAARAGHPRIQADVAAYPTAPLAGTTGLVASPPCQAWSMAGHRRGELDRDACHELADRMAAGDDSIGWRTWADDRSPLVCQPIRWVRDLRPEWVALEEVPAVLGLWQHFARILRGWGYSVWTGVLCAADFGVAQTRRRAILMASRTRQAAPPEPTHAERPEGVDLFGGSRSPWVSMADALGWGWDDEPSCTVSGGGVATGGAEPFANAGRRSIDEPAPTVLFGHRHNDTRWVFERPATTVVGSFRPDVVAAPGYRTEESRQNAPGSVQITIPEAAVLQSFPADYPWQGPKTRQYAQIGNAIPPLLAAHIIAALTGLAVAR